MIAKKAPTTTRHDGEKKGFFKFAFMKKLKKEKAADKIEKEKANSIFAEILEKPTNAPKTSRHTGRKSFIFFEEDEKNN